MKKRCEWVSEDLLYIDYHDREWGTPIYDDKILFEFLLLEGAQAGLSWITILRKRENYRKAYANFDPQKIACWTEKDIAKLMSNPGIIRNRAKIEAARHNARAFLDLLDNHSSFSDYSWQFVNNKPIKNKYKSWKEIPAKTKESEAFSKDLKKRGFKFVGPVIIYAHMQAVGMVNDHIISCYRYSEG